MKRLALTLSIILGLSLTMVGQNYMGMNQSKIVKENGQPDRIGDNFYVYTNMGEYGENIYYFDQGGNCISFEIVRKNLYLEEYQRILGREFTETCNNKFVKRTKKLNYIAELVLSKDTFLIKIQDAGNAEYNCHTQTLAGTIK